MKLTNSQINFFNEVGYLLIKKHIDVDLINKLEDIAENNKILPPYSKDDKGNVSKIFDLNNRDETFRKLISCTEIVEPLTSILGDNIVFVTNRHNHFTFLTPENDVSKFHRDTLQKTRNLVTVIIYMDDIPFEKGCLQVIPGSHTMNVSFSKKNAQSPGWLSEEDPEFAILEDQAVSIPGCKGDVLIFDGLLFHRAGINLTADKTRPTITLGYRAIDELNRNSVSSEVLVSGEFIYLGNDKHFN